MEEITMNVRSFFRSLSLSPNLVSYPDTGGQGALRIDRAHVDVIAREETSRAEHIHLQEHHHGSWTEKPLRPTDVPYERPGVIELMLMSGSR
jgi:hypothetical protein